MTGRGVATRAVASLTLIVAALMVGGCGERPQVVNYKQGSYSGKPDTPAYAGAPFNGDRAKWELEEKQRAQAQNEYKRIGG